MRRRLLAAVVCVLAVGGCSGSDNEPQAAPTTTTAPDPAVTACRETNSEITERKSDPALEQLTLSRDTRIATAAKTVESIVQDRELDPDPISPDLDLEYANALLELVRACKTAGYLP
jgi:hypothetical protein